MGVSSSTRAIRRNIELSPAFNVCDVGGQPTVDGAEVRVGRLFRGDSLHLLSPADGRALGELGLRMVIDLRTEAEVRTHGVCPPTVLDLESVHVPLIPRTWDADVGQHNSTATFLAERYLAILDECSEAIAEILRILSDHSRCPALIHCTIGNDRTGVVVALVLSLLGVPEHAIAENHAQSEDEVAALLHWAWESQPERREAFERVPAAHLAAPPTAVLLFLDVLRQQHGSVRRSVEDLGVEPEAVDALRAHLLHRP